MTTTSTAIACIARFPQRDVVVDAEHEFGKKASMMDADEAAVLIEQWLGEYRGGARPKAAARD